MLIGSKAKKYDIQEVLSLLASGFIKAGKGSSAVEMVRGASAINREIRVGVTHVSKHSHLVVREGFKSALWGSYVLESE